MKLINDNILTIVIFLPLAGAILLAFFPRRDRDVRYFALASFADHTSGFPASAVVFRARPERLPVRSRTSPGSPIPTFTITWAWTASRCGWSF